MTISGSPISLQVALFHSFYGWVYSIVYMYHIFFIHSYIDGHLGCFLVLASVNHILMNIEVHVSFWIMVFLGYMLRSGIAGSYAAAAALLQSCPTLCDPQTAAHQAPPSLGFSRQEHWSGLPLPSPMHESVKWKWSRSVVSDPQWPHGLQPSRLLRPWDFPGKSTGVGCHCLLWGSVLVSFFYKRLTSFPSTTH